jgi:protocatechuate 3,4-dioxygenase beta subunit
MSVSAGAASMLAGCTVCRSWAEQDEGPFHRDSQPVRNDVVEDRDGVPLHLGIRLARHDDRPVESAAVEIWQCDALGRYSGFPPSGSSVETAYVPDQSFLRGRQVTDAAGMVEFRTIYPGWYPGRTVHIHLIAQVDGVALTSQLYFPDNLTDRVLASPPYAERGGRDTTNASDEIFPTGGDPALLDVAPTDEGYRAAICLVLPDGTTR